MRTEENDTIARRIDLLKGRPEARRWAMGEAVYETLRSIGVLERSLINHLRTQCIKVQLPKLIFNLGIERAGELVMARITNNGAPSFGTALR